MRRLLVMLLLLTAGCAEQASPSSSAATSPGPSASPTTSPSSSPAPAGEPLPRLLYNDVAVAEVLLTGLDVELAVKNTVTAQYLPGTIVAQAPKAGALVKPGATVTVTVATPPACDPSYPTLCIAPFGPDKNCHDFRGVNNFPVNPPDRHRLDPDRDGVGCEK